MFATAETPFCNLFMKSSGEVQENEPNAHHKPPRQLPFPVLLSGSTQHLLNPTFTSVRIQGYLRETMQKKMKTDVTGKH